MLMWRRERSADIWPWDLTACDIPVAGCAENRDPTPSMLHRAFVPQLAAASLSRCFGGEKMLPVAAQAVWRQRCRACRITLATGSNPRATSVRPRGRRMRLTERTLWAYPSAWKAAMWLLEIIDCHGHASVCTHLLKRCRIHERGDDHCGRTLQHAKQCCCWK